MGIHVVWALSSNNLTTKPTKKPQYMAYKKTLNIYHHHMKQTPQNKTHKKSPMIKPWKIDKNYQNKKIYI